MDWLPHIIYPISRWLHIVAVTLIVGGTLFYELVVPVAIEDLKPEQQLHVFARARWIFRWVVYLSAALLVITGVVTFHRMWRSYASAEHQTLPFVIVHVAVSLAALTIALLLTVGGRPPRHPVRWMRMDLVILLVAIFTANVTRHVRLSLREEHDRVTTRLEDREKAVELREQQVSERELRMRNEAATRASTTGGPATPP